MSEPKDESVSRSHDWWPEFVHWLERFCHYSGAKAVYRKFLPVPNADGLTSPAAGLLWAIGIYAALFGIASGRYESALDRIENRQNGVYAQMGTANWVVAIARVPNAQQMTRPKQPDLFRFWTVFQSMFGEQETDPENVEALIGLIVPFKSGFSNLEMSGFRRRDGPWY